MLAGMEMVGMQIMWEDSMGKCMVGCRRGRRGMGRMVFFTVICLMGFSIIFVEIFSANVEEKMFEGRFDY